MTNEPAIRQLTDYEEALETLRFMGGYAFEPSPPLPSREEWEKWFRHMKTSRMLALFDGDRAVAMTCSAPMTENVRGRVFPMSGIWGVSTLPMARRNGYIRRLMGELLRMEREAGNPVTTLYPFRASFYERMGYTTFPQPHTARINPRDLAPLLRRDWGGAVDFMPIKDGWEVYRGFLEAYQQHTHGLALKSDEIALTERDSNSWLAVARVDGEPVGVMRYAIKGEEDNFTMHASRFYTTTLTGRYLLLDWIARHVDQIKEARVVIQPDELPETWFGDLATARMERRWPPMGRVLDLAELGGMQTGAGRVTVEVADPLCPWNTGTWVLEGGEGGLTVAAADGPADCMLTINGLSALVYGTHDPAMFAVRGWGDLSADALAALRTIFPPLLPVLHEHF